MKAELVQGKLIKVDGDVLTIIQPGTLETIKSVYPFRSITIDEGWLKRFLGAYVECKLVDGVIIDVTLPH